ncbi:hypothetical protein NDU88_002777 [Pleurodeles waltl]|uniref:Secreted protein n=1 Tax=Pleurodeles waltl TaxID=8319 RepID=A0AAV7VFZ1_PLEWA|nr:hypothetical protein NDU88_002777 [Pleurodeles waltl]
MLVLYVTVPSSDVLMAMLHGPGQLLVVPATSSGLLGRRAYVRACLSWCFFATVPTGLWVPMPCASPVQGRQGSVLWRPDQTDAAAWPGPRRKRDVDVHPARSRAVRRPRRLHPARRILHKSGTFCGDKLRNANGTKAEYPSRVFSPGGRVRPPSTDNPHPRAYKRFESCTKGTRTHHLPPRESRESSTLERLTARLPCSTPVTHIY